MYINVRYIIRWFMNERKPEHITFRVSAEFKELLRKQAEAQNRSMTAYLEWLVMQDAAAARTEPKNRRG